MRLKYIKKEKKKKEKEEQFVDFGTCLLESLLGAIK
jgi:hypothetical protein